MSAKTRAEQRGEVFAEDHDQFALTAVAEPAPEALRAARLVHWLRRPDIDSDSAMMPKVSTPTASQAHFSGSG